jgi:hypothetical protein
MVTLSPRRLSRGTTITVQAGTAARGRPARAQGTARQSRRRRLVMDL